MTEPTPFFPAAPASVLLLTVLLAFSCDRAQADFPEGSLREAIYTVDSTRFSFRAPDADSVRLHLYPDETGNTPAQTLALFPGENGIWKRNVSGNLDGQYYTFQVRTDGHWQDETAGLLPAATGSAGLRGAIVDPAETDPEGWEKDKRLRTDGHTSPVLYGLRISAFTGHSSSGIQHKGKYLALTETGTVSPQGLATGLDHLKELGITHILLLQDSLPGSRSRGAACAAAPDNALATVPADPAAAVREFKQMVQALHRAGIGIVLELPSFLSSGTKASERRTCRHLLTEKVRRWTEEYGLDGFCLGAEDARDEAAVSAVRSVLDRTDPALILCTRDRASGIRRIPRDNGRPEAPERIPGDLPETVVRTLDLILRDLPGLCAGNEMMLSGSINWNAKSEQYRQIAYCSGLIRLRRDCPVFRTCAESPVRPELLQAGGPELSAWRLENLCGGNPSLELIVLVNTGLQPERARIPGGFYRILAYDGYLDPDGLGSLNGNEAFVPARSAMILYAE